jgi:hypothetical protein
VLALVDALTHREGESLEDYLLRCASDPTALLIKRADLHDKLAPQEVPIDPAHHDAVGRLALAKLQLLDRLAG